jgi:16S rRNA processing protein RimM
MKKEYLECGKVCSAHGVRGFIKVEPWCDSPKVLSSQKRVFIAAKDGSYKEIAVRYASVSNKYVLMALEGIDTREAAQAEKNRILYLHRSDIPVKAGSVLIADMIGLPVYRFGSGDSLGVISDVSDVAGRRIYSIMYEGREVLLPDVTDFIKEIDEERGMGIAPIPGFFDDADEV